MNGDNEDITPKNSSNYSLKILWIPAVLLLVYILSQLNWEFPNLFPNHTPTSIGTILFDNVLVDTLYNRQESMAKQIKISSPKSGIDYLVSFELKSQNDLDIITKATVEIIGNLNYSQVLMATLYDGYNAYTRFANLRIAKIDDEKVQKRSTGLRNEMSISVTSISHHLFSTPKYYNDNVTVYSDGRFRIE